MEAAISFLSSTGVHMIRNDDKHCALLYASLSCYYENFMAVQTKATIGLAKISELQGADDHTLVSYYRKHTSCSCLDRKYQEVKSVKKMGLCYNLNCSHPKRKVERSTMFSCTRCGEVHYCSVDCQKDHLKEHKKFCDKDVELKAAFKSNQT